MAQATAGTPIMPGDERASLSSLIAMSGGLNGSITDALKGTGSAALASMAANSAGGNTMINYNYYVNGMDIGAESASTMTLSEIMQKLTVYAGQ